MNLIKIKLPSIEDNKITYQYTVEGLWQEVFTQERGFSIEYSCNISDLPAGIAIIPLLANLLPMAWVYDAEIVLPVCDEDFYNSIEAFKQGYRNMYPKMKFNGMLTVEHLQKNIPTKQKGSAAFFSGGVDAFNTLTCHADEKPTLLTLWGADVKLTDAVGWRRVEAHLQQTAKDFDVDYVTIKSGFRGFLDEGLLSRKVVESGDGWWHGFQHGIGIISHAAPAMYVLGKKTVYFASSFTVADKGKVTCASDPTIDNYVKFCGCNVVHDGYECTRQMKVHNITQFSKKTGKKIPLRVCWESSGGSNCCNCEKCWRTILGVYAEGFDPSEFGFEYDSFDSLLKKIYKNRETLKWHRESRYAPMQKVLRDNYSKTTVEPALRWFYKIDINKLGEIPLYKKIWRKGLNFARKLKKKLIH